MAYVIPQALLASQALNINEPWAPRGPEVDHGLWYTLFAACGVTSADEVEADRLDNRPLKSDPTQLADGAG
eukprot:scaffold9414_cov29-Prasinocladus_malaysianus.AAC.1